MLIRFLIQSLATYKALFGWLSTASYISNVIIRPALMVLLFGFVGRFASDQEGAAYYVLGRVLYSIVWIHIAGIVQSFFYERMFGTASPLFATPFNRFTNYVSRGVFHFPNGLVAAGVSLLVAWPIFGLAMGEVNWLPALSALMAVTASSVMFALFTGSIAMSVRDYDAVYPAFAGVLLVLTGSVIPVSYLPDALYGVSQILPLTHGREAFRAAFAGAGFEVVASDIGLELIIGLGYLAGGGSAFSNRLNVLRDEAESLTKRRFNPEEINCDT
jgi:ABC-2 type transport system permease protein